MRSACHSTTSFLLQQPMNDQVRSDREVVLPIGREVVLPIESNYLIKDFIDRETSKELFKVST